VIAKPWRLISCEKQSRWGWEDPTRHLAQGGAAALVHVAMRRELESDALGFMVGAGMELPHRPGLSTAIYDGNADEETEQPSHHESSWSSIRAAVAIPAAQKPQIVRRR
jgi:hypothetical protein